MRQWTGAADTPGDWAESVVAVGEFDGVHRGHQRTIAAAVELARRAGRPAIVATYPPPQDAPVLTGPRHQAELIEALGVDGLCRLPPGERPDPVALRASAVVVGAERRPGLEVGVDVHAVPMLDGVSTSSIRADVEAGDVAAAAVGLGRDHRVEGTVVRGAARGASQLGFPTANVDSPGRPAVPADGVYAGHLVVRGTPLPAAVSVGTNPTFDGVDRTVEAFVLDFSGDLYGDWVGVEFRARVRSQERFSSIEALIAQMTADVETIRHVLGQVTAADRDT